jgi:signal transduction histidine kinase
MGWEPTLYSLLAFGAAGISLTVATQIWDQRSERGAGLFIGLLLAAAGWSAMYGVQLGFSTEAGQLLWQRLGVAIGGTIPALWLLFACTYASRDQWLTRRVRGFLVAEPVAFALLALTNPVHEDVWTDLDLTETAVGPVLAQSFGPAMYVHLVVGYLLITAGLGVLFYVFLRNPTIYRTQTALLMLGALVPMSANIVFVVGFSRESVSALDPTPFTFVVTGVLVGLAFFRFDLLTRAPVARQHVLDEMGDGLLVLDTDGEVADANAVARQLLDADSLVGRPVEEVVEGGETGAATLEELHGRTLTHTVDDSKQAYDVQCAELTDASSEEIGHVVSFRNVTDRNRYEQRLEVTQRVLRHNLRNDVSVIRSHAERLAQNGHHPGAEQIVDTTDDLIDLSEKTRLITRIEGREEMGRVPVDVRERLEEFCTRFREEHPDVTLDCDLPASFAASVQDPLLFDIPVENLIENAIVHNDSDDRQVRVSARHVDDAVYVRIEDNGPEIPEMEHSVLESGSETPLQHGSSIGLWLAYWSVRTAGGTIEFETGDDGNVVTLEFPAAEQMVIA